MPARLSDKAVDLAEPKSAALADLLGREERLEDPAHHLRRHAFAGIGDPNRDVITGREFRHRLCFRRSQLLAAGRDAHAAALRHRVAGIDDQVQERGLELRAVDVGRQRPPIERHLELDRLRAGAAQHRFEPLDQGIDIVDLGAQGLAPRKSQQLLGQARPALGGPLRAVDDPPRLRIGPQARFEQVQAIRNHRQEIVEIVRHAAGQLPDRLHFLCLRQRGAGLFKRFFGAPLFGHVAGDLGEPDELAVGIENAVDNHTGPEPSAVLADAPALALVAALPRGDLQRAGRDAGGAILRHVELREMAADNLLRPVTFDAFAAEVPVCDVAPRVDHVDRVIGDALHQHAELLLAIREFGFVRLPCRKIAYRDRKPRDAVRSGAQGLNLQQDLYPLAGFRGEPAIAAEAAIVARLAQHHVDAGRRLGCEQPIESHPVQLVRRIAAGRLGRAGPARDTAVRIEQKQGGIAGTRGTALGRRFRRGRHRSTAINTGIGKIVRGYCRSLSLASS